MGDFNIGEILAFISTGIGLPVILSVIYSFNFEKYQYAMSITKGVFYLFHAGIAICSYFTGYNELYVLKIAVSIAIMEGLSLILIQISQAVNQNK